MAPMPTFAAEPDGSLGAAEAAYYRRRAEGGLAAVVTAGCAVSADGVSFEGQWRCDSDALGDSLARAAEAIHAGGALAVLQLCHNGLDDLGGASVEAFGAGARRAARAGFDAVELHGGHGYLLQRLFSRKTNARKWDWGGSTVAERARFPVAAVEAAAAEVGSVWYRLDPEEQGPHGITMGETIELARRLAAAGVEVFDVSAKDYFAGSIRDPEDREPRAHLLRSGLGGRAAVMAVGRISTPEEARRALADGSALVGLGRVLLGEPDWARKVQQGEAVAAGTPADDTLRSAAVPESVIAFLGRARRSR